MPFTFKLSKRLALMKASLALVAAACEVARPITAPNQPSSIVAVVITPYTADTMPGTYQVSAAATAAPVTGSSKVKNRGLLKQVIVTPAAAAVLVGGTLGFSAYGRTSSGDSVAVSVVYSATGGTISAAGL